VGGLPWLNPADVRESAGLSPKDGNLFIYLFFLFLFSFPCWAQAAPRRSARSLARKKIKIILIFFFAGGPAALRGVACKDFIFLYFLYFFIFFSQATSWSAAGPPGPSRERKKVFF
jgi:hypothetical protein